MPRGGAQFFLAPAVPAQRRYETLRAYLVDDRPAAEVAAAFGYSTATVHQMAAALRAGQLEFFVSSKPGPKGPRKQPRVRARVLELRAAGRSVVEIADQLSAEGSPASHQTVWEILRAEGIERLPTRPRDQRGGPPPTPAVKAAALKAWPARTTISTPHAGLFLLLPALADLGLPALVSKAGYPSTRALSAWQSIASLLVLELLRRRRVSHVRNVAHDDALGLAVGLTALPKTTTLTTYSYRVRRACNQTLQTGLIRRLRELGLATGEAGFNLDFHTIRHHGQDHPLETNYVPRRSQATRSVLTFFAQDHASTQMVYANADLTKAEHAAEIIAFADHWKATTGADPGLLVFDSQLTTYPMLDQLTARRIRWMTLRQRGKKILAQLAALPPSAWTKARIERAGVYRHPHLHDDTVTIKGIDRPVRQIAVKNIGRDQPTLLITNDTTTKAKDLFARYAHRMLIENELAAYITGFHLDALSSGLALNVDLDATLSVVAGNVYNHFARRLPRYQHATPDTLFRHFVDIPGRVHVADDHVSVRLDRNAENPVLLAADYDTLQAPIPWWNNRPLRFTFA